jgi:hypothetical protein
MKSLGILFTAHRDGSLCKLRERIPYTVADWAAGNPTNWFRHATGTGNGSATFIIEQIRCEALRLRLAPSAV